MSRSPRGALPRRLPDIRPEEYRAFRDYLERSCGILLGEHKGYLVASRLRPLLEEEGLESVGALVERARREPGSRLRQRIVDAMTTHETQWFRDRYPYEALRQTILPELAGRRPSRLRIWSAACSSGQEPYSIAMVVEEFRQARPGALPPVEIVATDVSPTILAQAEAGLYDGPALRRGLDPQRLQRFFRPEGGRMRVREELRRMVRFERLNLLEPFARLGTFQVVFCRNVLIYFAGARKKDVLERLAQVLEPGGYLVLGGTESATPHSDRFVTVRAHGGLLFRRR